MTIYRGYEVTKEPNGLYTWTDECGVIHDGVTEAKGGFLTDEQAMNDIDRHKREQRAAVTLSDEDRRQITDEAQHRKGRG